MKRTVLQHVYDVPEDRGYLWIATNADGQVNGFAHAPLRDFKLGVWQDSVTGDYGEPLRYEKWDSSAKEISGITDMSKMNPPKLLRERRKEKNASRAQ